MMNETERPEFWESAFTEKQEMWGFESAKSAVSTRDFFCPKVSEEMSLFPALVMGGMRKFS